MAILLLIRHGDNDVFKTRIAGRMPGVHLNSAGLQQVQALADSLTSAPITAIYSSPMDRALETAAPLAANHSLEVSVHPGLIEVDYGRLQGRTYKQLKRLKIWKLVHEQPSAVTFPEGESLSGVMKRIVAALDGLACQYGDHSLIACVTHGDLIRLAVAHYLGIPLDHYQCFSIATASITTLVLGKNRPQLLNLNQVNVLEWPKPPPEKPS
ncbi:MAG TPA: histidine phosphatase family protein [Longilinea sp.]|nr:histidine phosphatase family protein [Longilinea sp.]